MGSIENDRPTALETPRPGIELGMPKREAKYASRFGMPEFGTK
jgi:hypothetical protein